MSFLRGLFVALIAGAASLVNSGGAHAEAGPPDAEEMGRLFDTVCLQAFPDPATLDRQAAQLRAMPMTQQQTKFYLHQDPGRGWFYTTPLAQYVITIELPPFAACAIRRMTPAGLPTVRPYLAAVNNYVAARRAATVNLPAQQSKTPDGADLSAYPQAILAPGGQSATELFIVIITNYHGHFRGELSDDVGAGPGVEVRFVHQIPRHP